MTARVVDLKKAREEREPHMTGKARCLACRHEWIAVAPIGTVELECPSDGCGLPKGRFVALCEPDHGARWVCDCGNDLFWLTRAGMFCQNCGLTQRGWDE